MKRSHRIVAGLASAVALALAATAFAQSYNPSGPGGGPGMDRGWSQDKDGGKGPPERMHGRGGPGPMGHVNPAALVEARLAYLRTDLKITGAQESAWNTFAAKARKQAENRQAMREKMHERKGKDTVAVPERMEMLARAMKERAAAMEDMAAAVKELYAALTPEQKATADRDFAAHFHRRVAWNGPRR